MNFGEILDAVCKDGIAPSKRNDAKDWVRFRQAWLWDLEDWTFKLEVADITFTAGSRIVDAADAPADLHASLIMLDANGDPVRGYSDPRQFFRLYNANVNSGAASPEAYTIVSGRIFLSSPGDGSQGILVYEKSKPVLEDDGDPTGLPDGYDLGLVHGGKAEGFKLTNIPLAANFDADFTATANTMRRAYLNAVKEPGQQFGAYRP